MKPSFNLATGDTPAPALTNRLRRLGTAGVTFSVMMVLWVACPVRLTDQDSMFIRDKQKVLALVN